jgi:hypothetical protein
VAQIKVELVGLGDVIVITSPDLPKSVVISDTQYVEITKHLIEQAKPYKACAIKQIMIKPER